MSTSPDSVRAMVWHGDALDLLDQRLLPGEERWLRLEDADSVADAIREMVVRGAPAIGIAAAYGLALAARRGEDIEAATERLAAARPTAVNLSWALARMRRLVADGAVADADTMARAAEALHADDLAANRRMARLGAAELGAGGVVITHCNTGALATGGIGTALGVIRAGWAAGRISEVMAGETRPWLQGARLTVWELGREGIPARVMCDAAAAARMAVGDVTWVIVGADRVAANGDVANKVGTYGLAVLARRHGVRFMVVAPVSTIDPDCPDGATIPLEERPEAEVLAWAGHRMAPAGARAWNPVFDVTPAQLVDVLVTDRGVVHAPGRENLRELLATASDVVDSPEAAS